MEKISNTFGRGNIVHILFYNISGIVYQILFLNIFINHWWRLVSPSSFLPHCSEFYQFELLNLLALPGLPEDATQKIGFILFSEKTVIVSTNGEYYKSYI